MLGESITAVPVASPSSPGAGQVISHLNLYISRLDATLDEASIQRDTHHDHGWCQAPSENNLGVRLGRVTAAWRARVDATA